MLITRYMYTKQNAACELFNKKDSPKYINFDDVQIMCGESMYM